MRMLLPVVLLAACASYDLGYMSNLEPGSEPGTFRWRTEASTTWPINSASAEEARLGELRKIMATNCPGGYTVENRTATNRVPPNAIATGIWDVYYDVRCS